MGIRMVLPARQSRSTAAADKLKSLPETTEPYGDDSVVGVRFKVM